MGNHGMLAREQQQLQKKKRFGNFKFLKERREEKREWREEERKEESKGFSRAREEAPQASKVPQMRFVPQSYLSLLLLPVAATLVGESCREPSPTSELWTLVDGTLRAASSGGLCAEVQGALPLPGAGTEVTMVACNSTSPTQLFAYLSNGTLVLQGQPSHCLNLEAYGTSPGSTAWVTYCDALACKGNCAWSSSSGGQSITSATLKNSGLCLQDGSALPPLPHTCEVGSPSYALPFCDYTLPVDDRVSDLLSRLTLDQKIQQWNIGTGGFEYDPVLNLKVRAVFSPRTCTRHPPPPHHHWPPAHPLSSSHTAGTPVPPIPPPHHPPPSPGISLGLYLHPWR